MIFSFVIFLVRLSVVTGFDVYLGFTLSGGFGDDVLSGGDGSDQLTGDSGDDVITGEIGDDSVSGDELGHDTTSCLDTQRVGVNIE